MSASYHEQQSILRESVVLQVEQYNPARIFNDSPSVVVIMFNFLFLLTTLMGIWGTTALDMAPASNGRIIGGDATHISSLPYQVSLLLYDKHHCGGVIYNESIIITAAHCLLNLTASKLKVRAGSSFWNRDGTVIQVADFKLHENFNLKSFANDIALIRLVDALTFDSKIQSMPIAHKAPVDGTAAIVSGWGLTDRSANGKDVFLLRSADVKIINRDACASPMYEYGPTIQLSMICAQNVGKDACIGDSGGPLVANDLLVGIVSWGKGCAKEKFPGVYADVAYLYNWIENNAEDIKNNK
uniref:Peptidase S1 domain-containing protein n=1 Tax=Glossina brevipalpis TaxID=37001 RepID=A0A1A9WYW7_9MUSC